MVPRVRIGENTLNEAEVDVVREALMQYVSKLARTTPGFPLTDSARRAMDRADDILSCLEDDE